MRARLFALSVLVVMGCGTEQLVPHDGEPPAQPMIYVWGDGFLACGLLPAARGLPVVVTAVAPAETPGSLESVAVELRITDAEGNAIPLAHENSNYVARFERVGTYRIEATYQGGALEPQTLVVEEAAGIALAPRGRTLVTQDASGSCRQSLDEGALPPLAANQQLIVAVIAVDEDGRPLVGGTTPEFSGDLSVRPEFPSVGFTDPYVRHVFEAGEPGPASVRITDTTLGLVLEQSFTVDGLAATCASQ